MNTLDEKKLRERHRQMLAYQKKIHPFTPKMRALQKLWGVGSVATVSDTIENMVRFGMVKVRPVSDVKNEYYAIEV